MVAALFALRGGNFLEAAGNGGGPKDVECLCGSIEKQFGGPTVFSGRFVHHDGYGSLRSPVNEIFGRGIADDAIRPTGCPDHVEYSVGALTNAGVSHEFVFSYFGSEVRISFAEWKPRESIMTIGQMESVFSSSDKIRK